jgi:uroporphyrinogen-III decarboxylase
VKPHPGDTMTARERILGALNGTPVDRVPIFDIIQHIELCEHVTGQKVTPQNGLDLLLATIGECLDMTRGVAALAPPAPDKVWQDDEGFVYRAEWWTQWIVERPFVDTRGYLEYVRRLLDQLADLPADSLYTFFGRHDVWARDSEDPQDHYRRLQERLGDVLLLPSESPVGLDTAYHRAGLEQFVYGYAEEPELVSQLLEALYQHEVRRVHRCADAALAPVALVYADLANKHGPMFSPAFLRLEFFPRLRGLVDAWHAHGVKVIFHSDGDYRALLDDVQGAGVDGVNPVEKLERADHLRETRAGWPGLAMVGGIDCSNLLPFGTPDEVRAAVRHALEVTRPGGRYVLGSTTELHPACDLRNILTMWDAALEYGRT